MGQFSAEFLYVMQRTAVRKQACWLKGS